MKFVYPCALASALVIVACGPSGTSDSNGGDDDTSTTSGVEDGTGPGSSEETSTGTEPAVCGNGIVEVGELCDDGNDVDDDDCDNSCVPRCGPVWVQSVAEDDQAINTMSVSVDAMDRAWVVGESLSGKNGLPLWQRPFGIDGRAGAVEILDIGIGPGSGGGTVARDQDGNWIVVKEGRNNTPSLNKYDGDNGSLLWSVPIDGPLFGGVPDIGIAIAPDNNVIYAASREVMPIDGQDLWVGKLDTTDASEIWSTPRDDALEFGVQYAGGPVAVDADGNVFVLGTRFEDDANEGEVRLVAFPPDGGLSLWELAPSPNPADWAQTPLAITIDQAGGIVLAIDELTHGPEGFYSIVARYEGDQQGWVFRTRDLDLDGAGHSPVGARFALDGAGNTWVFGDYNIEPPPEDHLLGVWGVRLDSSGAPTCQHLHVENGIDLRVTGVASFSDGTAAVAGVRLGANVPPPGVAGWVGRFRP